MRTGGERALSANEQRVEGSALVAQVVVLTHVVLADEAQERRARDLILQLDARDFVAPDKRVIGAPPIILVSKCRVDPSPVTRTEAGAELYEIDVRLRPLEKVLVLAADVKDIAAEAGPLRCRE